MPNEVLESGKLQRNHRRDDRRPAQSAREHRDDADLDDKPTEANEVEYTPALKIDPHT